MDVERQDEVQAEVQDLQEESTVVETDAQKAARETAATAAAEQDKSAKDASRRRSQSVAPSETGTSINDYLKAPFTTETNEWVSLNPSNLNPFEYMVYANMRVLARRQDETERRLLAMQKSTRKTQNFEYHTVDEDNAQVDVVEFVGKHWETILKEAWKELMNTMQPGTRKKWGPVTTQRGQAITGGPAFTQWLTDNMVTKFQKEAEDSEQPLPAANQEFINILLDISKTQQYQVQLYNRCSEKHNEDAGLSSAAKSKTAKPKKTSSKKRKASAAAGDAGGEGGGEGGGDVEDDQVEAADNSSAAVRPTRKLKSKALAAAAINMDGANDMDPVYDEEEEDEEEEDDEDEDIDEMEDVVTTIEKE